MRRVAVSALALLSIPFCSLAGGYDVPAQLSAPHADRAPVSASFASNSLEASNRFAEGMHFGVQGSWGDDSDFGVGGRVILGLGGTVDGLALIGSFDYFFPDDGLGVDVNYWEINGNLAYGISSGGSIEPYLGAGVNIAHASVDASGLTERLSDTDVGLNLLGGLRFGGSSLTPFVEGRIEIEGGKQFVVTGGVTF